MPTDISGPPLHARSASRYVLRAAAVGLGLFGLLRLPWTESNVVWPLTRLQSEVAAATFGTPAVPVSVTLACSGTEVLAMCLGAVLAYPVRWRLRLLGAFGIGTGIVVLNTARIGTLGVVAASPRWFDALHLYIWPALLMLASACGVLWWMRRADRTVTTPMSPSLKFAGVALALLTLSALSAPLYLDSAVVGRIGGSIASAAALILTGAGAAAHATSNVLWTARGGFSVTGECVATPLLPVYLAAVWVYSPTWARVFLGTLAAAPIFLSLGVVRLLLVAVPQSLTSTPEFAVHAFYQIVLAVALVAFAGRWRHGVRRAIGPVAIGIFAALAFIVVAGTPYTNLVLLPVDRASLLDPQGAVAFLPSFQVALYLALWLAAGRAAEWKLPAFGLLAVIATHLAGAWGLTLSAVPLLLASNVSSVRAWAIAGPVLMLGVVVTRDRATR